jgi:hypothetical protein
MRRLLGRYRRRAGGTARRPGRTVGARARNLTRKSRQPSAGAATPRKLDGTSGQLSRPAAGDGSGHGAAACWIAADAAVRYDSARYSSQ